MSALGRRLRAVAVALLAAGAAWAPPAAAQTPPPPPEPRLDLLTRPVPVDPTSPLGGTFKLEGQFWPANTLVELEVCGNLAVGGSVDCAVESGQVVSSGDDGHFVAQLPIVIPPSPCPCVVRAVNETSSTQATVAVDVPGAPVAQPDLGNSDDSQRHRLEVSDVALEGSDDWKAWLGGRPHRTLRFTLTNTGLYTVKGATVSIVTGDPANPDGFVEPVSVDRLDVGESRDYTVPVSFDALSFGRLAAEATVAGTSKPLTFAADTSSYPWLLVILPIVVLAQLVLLLLRNRARRRLHRRALADRGYDDDSAVVLAELTDEQSRKRVTIVRGVPAIDRLLAAPPPGTLASLTLYVVAGTTRAAAEALIAHLSAVLGDGYSAIGTVDGSCLDGDVADPLAGGLRGLVPCCMLVRHDAHAEMGAVGEAARQRE